MIQKRISGPERIDAIIERTLKKIRRDMASKINSGVHRPPKHRDALPKNDPNVPQEISGDNCTDWHQRAVHNGLSK
jgi:hypothetical protein